MTRRDERRKKDEEKGRKGERKTRRKGGKAKERRGKREERRKKEGKEKERGQGVRNRKGERKRTRRKGEKEKERKKERNIPNNYPKEMYLQTSDHLRLQSPVKLRISFQIIELAVDGRSFRGAGFVRIRRTLGKDAVFDDRRHGFRLARSGKRALSRWRGAKWWRAAKWLPAAHFRFRIARTGGGRRSDTASQERIVLVENGNGGKDGIGRPPLQGEGNRLGKRGTRTKKFWKSHHCRQCHLSFQVSLHPKSGLRVGRRSHPYNR